MAELGAELFRPIPEDWLHESSACSAPRRRRRFRPLGGPDALLEQLRRRLAEQQGEHHGGSKWIGTGGTSPFGHSGYHPEGVRIGGQGRQRRA